MTAADDTRKRRRTPKADTGARMCPACRVRWTQPSGPRTCTRCGRPTIPAVHNIYPVIAAETLTLRNRLHRTLGRALRR